jgi:hypothetical protein
MRFLGPRSLSSLLKTALTVVYFGLMLFSALIFIALLFLLSLPARTSEIIRQTPLVIPGSDGLGQWPLAFFLLAFGLTFIGYLMITRWTRQVFSTLADGDVFHPDNTRRLRLIGFGLGLVEVFGYGARLTAEHVLGVRMEPAYGLRAVSTWFSVLVVFVLAEVFKEGARLRAETDLTI